MYHAAGSLGVMVALGTVGPPRGMHMSRRITATMDVGLQKCLFLPATAPVGELGLPRAAAA